MPLFLDSNLPAFSILKAEGCDARLFYENEYHEPLEILYINQMPDLAKTSTDVQWGRLLAAAPFATRIHRAQPCDNIDWSRYDGLLLTGANCEHKEPRQIPSWKFLQEILDQSKQLTSSLFVCWGAQIALEHDYGIKRRLNNTKLFGICSQQLLQPRLVREPFIPDFVNRKDPDHELFVKSKYTSQFAGDLYEDLLNLERNWRLSASEAFSLPVSRYGYTDTEDARKRSETLEIIFDSPETHAGLLCSKYGDRIYSNNHPEYDRETLGREYIRDHGSDDPPLPKYYPLLRQMNDTSTPPWRAVGQTIVNHWLRKLATGRQGYQI